jgi:hypothetical protein
MAREFRTDDLQVWEAFATTGEHGFAERSKIGFRCRTDRSARPRWIEMDVDKSDVEARIQASSPAELEELFHRAAEVV